MDPDICVNVVASLRKEFASRFAGVRPLDADFKLFTAPLTFPWTTPLLPAWSWWSYSAMMNRRRSSTTLPHCPSSATSHSLLGIFIKLNTLRIVAMFGGTYCCEQLFSKMKYTKSRLRSLLLDRHLNDILLLSSSSNKPDIDILLHGKQRQPFYSFACFAIKVLLCMHPRFGVFVCHSGPRAAPESLIWHSL